MHKQSSYEGIDIPEYYNYHPQPTKLSSHNNSYTHKTSSSQYYPPVILCAQEELRNAYKFPKKDEEQIKQIILSKSSLETLLKHIHRKFYDEGLQYTLIHKIYQCTNEEIEFYVPELVYIAIRKSCKPIKKLLIYKASNNEALRRLILWNVKAFTVLMKQKDPDMKKTIEDFQEQIISTVKSRSKFNHSQKAIAMITTASLILKKLQPGNNIKEMLKKFIKRYNRSILNNLHHAIIIPFRQQKSSDGNGNTSSQKFHSNYVVRIVEDDCSCFPTRKRVPYRIIIETIDPIELMQQQPAEEFFKQKMDQKDEGQEGGQMQKEKQNVEDLFDEVTKSVEQILGHNKVFKSILNQNQDNRYPFVIDQEESVKMSELMKFAKKIEKEEKEQQKEKEKQNNLIKSKFKNSFLKRKNTVEKQDRISNEVPVPSGVIRSKNPYQVVNNQNLKKFQAIFIPTLPSRMRKSAHQLQTNFSQDDLFIIQKRAERPRYSYQSVESEKSQTNIKVIEEETRWNAAYEESAWGLPWIAKEKKYKSNSYFRKFASLKLHNVVVKGGDDLRQEIVCMQLIYKIEEIIKKAGVMDIFIKPYEIIVLSENSGILEFVSNSISIDAMKKDREGISLSQFFSQVFQTQQKLLDAKQKFIRSLVGSSILTYVLKLKDRHNGNILLDNEGHIIHIDFGFILGMSPGGINFESSPFKLTEEYVDFMGGKGSPDYEFFEELFCDGMGILRKHMDQLCLMLEIMMDQSDLECFQNFNIESFKERFKPSYSEAKYRMHCLGLIEKSCMNTRTNQYDFFQWYTNGIHQ